MKVTDSWHVAGMTLLVLSGSVPSGEWQRIVIDGKTFEAITPMYAGDISRAKNNTVGIRGSHDFDGKTVEFV